MPLSKADTERDLGGKGICVILETLSLRFLGNNREEKKKMEAGLQKCRAHVGWAINLESQHRMVTGARG